MAKNRALKVGIEDGEVVIRIGVGTLRVAAEQSEDFHGAEGSRYVRVFDPDRFAAGIVEELNEEAEDGTTHVHEMFDKAFLRAIDNGIAMGCDIVEEGDFRELVKRYPDKGPDWLWKKQLAEERARAKDKAIREGTYP